MKKATKVWLIVATSFVVIGGILIGGVTIMLERDKFETNTYGLSETFESISIDTATTDVVFVLSDDGACKVECYESKNKKHSVAVENEVLVIADHPQKWYEHIQFSFKSPKITVYLPDAQYDSLLVDGSTGNVEIPNGFSFNDVEIKLSTGAVAFCGSTSGSLKIQTSTGAVCVENASAGTLDLAVTTGTVTVSGVDCRGNATVNVSTGKASITDLVCKSILSEGTTGDIFLKNVIATEKLSIERNTGDVKFEGADAAEIFVKTGTGDVKGTLLTDKVFITQTNTGAVDVPKTVSGGKCEIITNTGAIQIKISQ